MNLPDGEHRLFLNGIRQWIKVAGVEHGTVPLLLLHGGPGGNHYNFERTVGPLLEAQRTVIYHEQRGCGRSDAPPAPDEYSLPLLVSDVDALLDTLELAQVDVLGYSFGGGLALEYALAHPERVRRLVLQAPALHLLDPEIVAAQVAGFREVARAELAAAIEAIYAEPLTDKEKLEQIWGMVDTSTVDRFLFQSSEKAAYNRQLWQASGLTNTGDMARALKTQPPTTAAQRLGEVTHPTLILAGRHDRNVPPPMLADMARRLPNAQLQLFEHSAHFPDIEETQLYARAALAFLA